MKQIYQVVVIFFFIFFYSIASARLLPLLQDNEMVKAIETTSADSSSQRQGNEPFELLGMEEMKCDAQDKDCIMRRMVAEAHVDYIYTQRNKPQIAKP